MVRLEVNPSEITDFWREKLEELKQKWLLMASNDVTHVEIFMTEENGHPQFCVDYCGETVHDEGADLGMEAVYVYRELLNTFLFVSDEDEGAGDPQPPEEEDSASPFTAVQMDRIRDITCAAEDLLTVLLEDDIENFGLEEGDIADLVYRIEKTLFEEYGITVYHPYIIEDDSVTDFPFGDPEEEWGDEEETADDGK